MICNLPVLTAVTATLTLIASTAAAEPEPIPASGTPMTFSNPVSEIYLADPYCFQHDGTYYAVGTGRGGRRRGSQPAREFPMVRSRDLRHWEVVGPVLEPPAEEIGGPFWAPEIAFNDGTFYLYYHPGGHGKSAGFRIRVATSKTPAGPYADTGKPMTDVKKNAFIIDSTTFRDDDGQWYMFYATDFYESDEKTFRGTALVMDRMKSMTELEGNPQTVMRAHWRWQLYEANRLMGGVKADWFTLEGPSVVKRNGKYYCFYSGGNYQNDTYGVDYLTADKITGPWTEAGEFRGPQIMRSIPGKVTGPGHNSIFSSADGKQDYIAYHAWNRAMTARQLWIDPLTWTGHGPRVERFAARIEECNRQAEEARRRQAR